MSGFKLATSTTAVIGSVSIQPLPLATSTFEVTAPANDTSSTFQGPGATSIARATTTQQVSALGAGQPGVVDSTIISVKPGSVVAVDPRSSLVRVADDQKLIFNVIKFGAGPYLFPKPPSDDTRYNDLLPSPTTNFTPYESLTGVSSTRPEIVAVADFVPLYQAGATGFTPAGDFVDAQIKLDSLRRSAASRLLSDMRSNKDLASQLDLEEAAFVRHIRDLQNNVSVLADVQDRIARLSRFLDIRDASNKIDVGSILSRFFSQVIPDVNVAATPYPPVSYPALLYRHGFSPDGVRAFTGTKVYLQILNELKRCLRIGTDDVSGVPSKDVAADRDPITMTRRSFRDIHALFASITSFTLAKDILANGSFQPQSLVSFVGGLQDAWGLFDSVFDGTSDEDAFVRRIRLLSKEYSYSRSLAFDGTVSALNAYGHVVSETSGNQTMFDAVAGQLGNRISDDRSSVNRVALGSIASRVVGNVDVLTFESQYVENSAGSVFTPGSSFYASSVLSPSDQGFDSTNAEDLANSAGLIVNQYVDLLGRLDILPEEQDSVLSARDPDGVFIRRPDELLGSLYALYVDENTDVPLGDVLADPVVDLLRVAAKDARLRANLLAYVFAAGNISSGGNEPTQTLSDIAAQSLRQEDITAAGSLDTLVKACLTSYSAIRGKDSVQTSLAQIERSMRRYNERSTVQRIISLVVRVFRAFKVTSTAFTSAGRTRYSSANDTAILALTLQLALDAAVYFLKAPVKAGVAVSSHPSYVVATNSSSTADPRAKIEPTFSSTPTPSVNLPPLTTLSSSSRASLRRNVSDRLLRDQRLTILTAFAPLMLLQACRDDARDLVSYVQSPHVVFVLNELMKTLGDRELVSMLSEPGQTRLIVDAISEVVSNLDLDDRQSKASNAGLLVDDLQVLDDTSLYPATVFALQAALASPAFDESRASNLKIISVGLPHAFTSHLRSILKTTTFAEQVSTLRKQEDVISLDVYRVDARYEDIIFQPLTFTFETSRFVSRDRSLYSRVRVGASLQQVLDSIPTVDRASRGVVGGALESHSRVYRTPDEIVHDGQYSFMQASDIRAMARNHVMSYLLELYVRLTTGLPVSEREMSVADVDNAVFTAPFLVRAAASFVSDVVFAAPSTFNARSNVPSATRAQFATINAVAEAIASPSGADTTPPPTPQQVTDTKAYVSAISDLRDYRTVYSNRGQFARRLLMPRTFERAFFVPVDPDDFDVDVDATNSSPVGRSTMAQLIQAGLITSVEDPLRGTRWKLRPDVAAGNTLSFDKYFVVARGYEPSDPTLAIGSVGVGFSIRSFEG